MSEPGRGPVRVAVVGTGWWGRQHLRVFSSSPRSTLCAVVGRDPERTAAAGAEFGAPAYIDIGEMLTEARPDLVSLCLPNDAHFAPTMRVIEAGVPLLVEKPLAFEPDECDAMLAAAAEQNLFFAINFNHRYARPALMAHEAIRAGRLGKVVFASWRFGGDGGSAHHPHANLIETQCHGFDLLEHLCGPIARVAMQVGSVGDTDGAPGTMAVSLAFDSGAVGTLLGSYATSYAYERTHVLEVCGTKGRVLIDDTVRRYALQGAGSETAEVWQAGYFEDEARSFERTFDAHADAILEAFAAGEPPPVHASAGRRALDVARACITSAEEGRTVSVR